MAGGGSSGTALGVSVGSRCYVPDAQRMWLPAVVEDVDERKRTVAVRLEPLDGDESSGDSGDGERRVVTVADGTVLPLQNAAPQLGGCDDMIELNHLHEAAILYNLKRRFHARRPYTYTGDICVALNPYQWLDELYSPELHTQYLRASSRRELPPHVYAVAVAAYRHMKQGGANQSILVSGESGAGKTETTKIVMDNLAAIARVGAQQQETIARIIEVNPLLESFGNAKTKRNDNSSRFGKFTQLQFDDAHVLCGAKCETYLLEKTRVTTQEPGERNYHIFYQLLHGATPAERAALGLEREGDSDDAPPPRFAYVREDASLAAKDRKNLAKTKHALALLGLAPHAQDALFQGIAGILHLGEAAFGARADNEDASRLEPDSVAYSSVRLGLEPDAMDRALCSRTMKAGGEVYAVPLSAAQATSGRDALAKALYARIFDWMVARVNASLSADAIAAHAIGVLDIFGFESFAHNSYEQLCINYANEKLQQKFTQDVFTAVADEYARERISWAHIEYADNAQVLALIESKLGIIALLNEELVRPKGSDEGFVGKLAAQYRTSKAVVEFARLSRTQFTVHHYADSVQYEAQGFLEKHKDALSPDLSELMRGSAERFLRELFETGAAGAATDEPPPGPPSRKRVGGGSGGGDAGATVGTQFKVSLNRLMENIGLTNVHYIRCIKPNSVKSAHEIDEQMVVSQLRCAGVIEAISIARAGYPNRLLHAAFADEFAIFLSDAERERCDAVASCAALVRQFALQTPAEFQMGATKIYLQKGVLERLEHARAAKLFAFAARIQSAWRGLCARRWYDALRCALVVLQRRAKVFVATRRCQRTRAAAALVQRVWRGHVGRMAFFAVLCEHRALQIQRVWRGHAGRRVFAAVLRADRAVRIQCAFRRCLARRELARRRSTHAREQARLRELEKQRRELEKQRRAEDARLQRLAEEESAVTIQRLARGFLARSAFAKLVAQAAAETQRLQRLAEEEERERLRLEVEAAEREEQRRREAEEREAQRLLALQREEEEREAQRLLALQREEEERARQLEAERQREAEAQEQAAVTVQKLTRGRLARQQFAVLRVEAARENATNAELLAAHAENTRLRKQLEEILEANLELESLVTEWTCEREVLDASNHVKELELRQRISAKKQQLAAAHAEYTSLAEQLGNKNRSRSATETVDSNGSTETETLSSASERDDDDDDDDEDWAEHPHHDGDLEDFDTDRPSTDVSRLLDERARKSATPRFSNAMKQPKEKSSQLLRAGASKFGLAKKWVNSAAAARRTGRAAKVHGEADADSPVVQTKSGERGVAL